MKDKNPFPGAQPYRAEEHARFHARGPLVKKLVNQVLSCTSTTVFGPSGAGKSSLMQAGVIPVLQDSKDVRVVRVDAWPANEPLLSWLVNEIFIDFDLGRAPKEKPPLEALKEAIDLAVRRSDRQMLIYLDQIEQIFLSERSLEELEMLLQGLTWLTDQAPGDVHLVLSLREDYLGRLRDLTRERPELSAHGFRVAPLSVKEMVAAMCQTAKEGDPPQAWDTQEIRKLMLDVRVPGQNATDEAEVQTAFGQIVCRALFDERATGQTAPRGANAEAILQRHLDTTLAGMGSLQELAQTLLEEHLIDDAGHRRLLTEKEARLLMRTDQVVDVLDKLDAARVLRAEEHQGSRYFEVGHDWLAKKLLEKRIEHKDLARAAKEKRRRRTLLTIVTLTAGALVVVSLLAVFAWDRMNEARRVQSELKVQTEAANLAKEDAVRASQMAGVRELLASGKPSGAAMVLAEVDKPEKARGWRQLAIDLLAKDLPWRTVRFEPEVNVIAWSPDGLHIATASNDDIVHVWNAKSMTEFAVLKPHYGKVRGIAWSPDGQYIATACDDKVIRLWKADGIGEPVLLTGHVGELLGVAWSPGGERIVSASADKTARVWNANGSGESIVLKGHEGWVLSVAWSPDGKRIMTASQDNTARIWNSDGSGNGIVVQGHDQSVSSAAWSPDGTRIVTTSVDKTARVWNINEINKSAEFTEHEGAVLFAAWSPDGRRIVTTSGDHTARVWNADGLGVSRILAGHEAPVVSARWSEDGKQVFTTSLDNTARVWNVDQVGGRIRFDGHAGFIASAVWSPDGKRFATSSIDNTIRIWNADGSGDGVVFKKQEHKAISIAWSPDGRRIAAALSDTARVWNADGSGESVVFAGHEGHVYSVAWSPDGKRLATASVDKTARIWNAESAGKSIVLEGHEGYVASVRWSPDGQRIATASEDKTARIWNADGSGKSIIFKGHEQAISSVAWSPTGSHIVTASGDATARIWSVDGTGETIVLRGHGGPVSCAAFSPNGEWIVTGSFDNTARIWESSGKGESIVLRGHRAMVTSASFSPDGRRILTASYDATALVWLADFALLQQVLGDVTAACLTPTERETYLLEMPLPARDHYQACERKNGRPPNPAQ